MSVASTVGARIQQGIPMRDLSPHSRARDLLDAELASYDLRAVEVVAGLLEQLQTAEEHVREADEDRDHVHARNRRLEEQLEAARGLLVRSLPMTIAAYQKSRGLIVQPLNGDIKAWLDSNPASEPAAPTYFPYTARGRPSNQDMKSRS